MAGRIKRPKVGEVWVSKDKSNFMQVTVNKTGLDVVSYIHNDGTAKDLLDGDFESVFLEKFEHYDTKIESIKEGFNKMRKDF